MLCCWETLVWIQETGTLSFLWLGLTPTFNDFYRELDQVSLNYVVIDSGNWGPPQDSLGILPTILCFLFVYLCSLSSLLFPLNPQQVTVDDGVFLNLLTDKGVFLLKGSSSSPLFPKALHGASSDCLSFLSNLWCPYLTLWFTKLKHLKATVVNWHYKKSLKIRFFFFPPCLYYTVLYAKQISSPSGTPQEAAV